MRKDTKYPVSVWERAIARRGDIEFEEVTFENGAVSGVTGYILIKGGKRPARWSADGRCHYKGQRARSYDIRF